MESNLKKKLKVGDNLKSGRGTWDFGGDVSKTFVEHAKKSIMGYEEGHKIICKLSDFFCKENNTILDIGVSTGELLKKMVKHNNHKKNLKYIGIDNQKNMIAKAKSEIKNRAVRLEVSDITKKKLPKNEFTISYYTLQFIPPKYRQKVFDNIYSSLSWGGGFVMFEKVRGSDARFQDIMSNLYVNFKTEMGFSASEILGKAESIKGVLEPFSTDGNIGLLKRAGFVDVMSIYKNICFEGFFCIK